MRELCFKIYIGSDMKQGQSENMVALLELPEVIPKGQYTLDGRNMDSVVAFPLLDLLGNYIADWIDLTEKEELIKAKIYLNKVSQFKVFKGKEIVRVIDFMAKENNRTFNGTFNDVLGDRK